MTKNSKARKIVRKTYKKDLSFGGTQKVIFLLGSKWSRLLDGLNYSKNCAHNLRISQIRGQLEDVIAKQLGNGSRGSVEKVPPTHWKSWRSEDCRWPLEMSSPWPCLCSLYPMRAFSEARKTKFPSANGPAQTPLPASSSCWLSLKNRVC